MTLSGTGGMTSVTGGSYPARIFTAYMKAALKDLPVKKFAGLPSGQPNGANPTDSPSASPTPTPAPVVLVTLPNLQGASVADATSVLQGLGLVVILELQPDVNPDLPLFVLELDPPADTQVNSGTTIKIKMVNALP
jgi:membrane peptidoglycan carboxypeptidase